MVLLVEPVPVQLRRQLRRAVVDLAGGRARRRFAAIVHAGTPGGSARRVPAAWGRDFDLRCQVASALRESVRPACPRPLLWLTRPGAPQWHDLDAAWLGALLHAAAETGDDLTFVVVTRHGWYDPRTGVSQVWSRVRPARDGLP